MKCPNCSFNNVASATHCAICGTELEITEDAKNDTLALDEALKAIFAGNIKASKLESETIEGEVGLGPAPESNAPKAWEPLDSATLEADRVHTDSTETTKFERPQKPEHHEHSRMHTDTIAYTTQTFDAQNLRVIPPTPVAEEVIEKVSEEKIEETPEKKAQPEEPKPFEPVRHDELAEVHQVEEDMSPAAVLARQKAAIEKEIVEKAYTFKSEKPEPEKVDRPEMQPAQEIAVEAAKQSVLEHSETGGDTKLMASLDDTKILGPVEDGAKDAAPSPSIPNVYENQGKEPAHGAEATETAQAQEPLKAEENIQEAQAEPTPREIPLKEPHDLSKINLGLNDEAAATMVLPSQKPQSPKREINLGLDEEPEEKPLTATTILSRYANPMFATDEELNRGKKQPKRKKRKVTPVYEIADEADTQNKTEEEIKLTPVRDDNAAEPRPANRKRNLVDEIIIIMIIILMIALGVLIYYAIRATGSSKNPETIPISTPTSSAPLEGQDKKVQPNVAKIKKNLADYLTHGIAAGEDAEKRKALEAEALSELKTCFIDGYNVEEALKPLNEINMTKLVVGENILDPDAKFYEIHTAVLNEQDGKIYERPVTFIFKLTDTGDGKIESMSHDFDLETDPDIRTIKGEAAPTTTTTDNDASEEETTSTEESSPAQGVFDESYFTTSGTLYGGTGSTPDTLRQIRMGDHYYFHRFVFDFLGYEAPNYSVSITDGGYKVQVVIENITDYPEENPVAEWSYVAESIEILRSGENNINVVITMVEPVYIYTYWLEDPGRIIVDIRGDSNLD